MDKEEAHYKSQRSQEGISVSRNVLKTVLGQMQQPSAKKFQYTATAAVVAKIRDTETGHE